jgi:hypothetical protein
MKTEVKTQETKTVTVWAAQKIVAPTIGGIMPNPMHWMTDEFGAGLDTYGETLPSTGEIVQIGAYEDGAYWVAVQCEVSARLAKYISKKDIAE